MSLLSVTGPIFCLILIGLLSVRSGYFPRDGLQAIGRFVIAIAMPALIFNSLSHLSIRELWRPDYLAAYGGASVLAFVVGLAASRLRRQTAQAGAVRALGMSVSNSAFVGYPIALQAFGPIASIALALNLLIENLLMFPAAFMFMDSRADRNSSWGRVKGALKAAVSNPIIIAAALGLLFALYDIRLPAPVEAAIEILGRAATAAALVFVGGSLSLKVARGDILDAAGIALGKLVLHPALIALAFAFFAAANTPLGQCAIIMGAAPMVSVYGVIGQRANEERLCATALATTTLASFVTMNVGLALLSH